MNLQIDPAELLPLIRQTVAEVLATVATLPSDRLGFSEGEAAGLLGMRKCVLRDARLRGEVKAKRVGKQIYYSRDELTRFLTR